MDRPRDMQECDQGCGGEKWVSGNDAGVQQKGGSKVTVRICYTAIRINPLDDVEIIVDWVGKVKSWVGTRIKYKG